MLCCLDFLKCDFSFVRLFFITKHYFMYVMILCTAIDTDSHFSNLVQHYAYGSACHSNCIVLYAFLEVLHNMYGSIASW